jgi:hypothetical protein
MQKTILKFGLISGILSSVLMCSTLPFTEKLGHSLLLGYTTIVLAFLLVYFGIRSYRDTIGNGHITFARAFSIGIAITLISCLFYVITWQILYFNFMHNYMDNYNAHMIAQLKASGASAAVIQDKMEQAKKFKEMYENPLFNAAVTLLEPLPVGLVMTLLSAAILRKKAPPQPAQPDLATSY